MRKVIFTEEQINRILGEGSDMFLDNFEEVKEIPKNAYGQEVFSDLGNADKDVPKNDVTTLDNKSQKMCGGHPFSVRKRRVYESNFDDERVKNFGKNEKSAIVGQANSGNGGKMIKNIAKEIANGGSKVGTGYKRINDLEKEKKENPALFASNGGNETLKALKSSVTKSSNSHKTQSPKLDSVMTQTPDVNKGSGKGHHSEQENVYYY